MKRVAGLLAAWIAGLWAGILLCIGAIAAPAAFATLARPDAGRFVNRLFEQDAYLSIGVAVVLFAIERQRSRDAAGPGSVFSANLMIVLGTLFCTVGGYFAVQPMMDAARAGRGAVSFGMLHAVSAGFFVLKTLLVLALAWRLSATTTRTATTS